jgi:hypothetical protein
MTEGVIEEELLPSPRGRKAVAVAERTRVYCGAMVVVTKGSWTAPKETPPGGYVPGGREGLASSGEKAVSEVSGVPSAESACPLDECGD